jgi:GT2 family glycosyltransferase
MFSVVIPTFDTAQMTLACWRAVEADEVIVVDDASTDGTYELLRGQGAEVLRLESNRGFAGAANAGVAKTRGDVVLLLNSDAIVERGAIEALRAAFAADPKLGIAGARLSNEDGTPQWSAGPLPTLPWLLVMISGVAHVLPRRPAPRDIAWVSGAAMAFRREVWEAAGPLRENYRFYAQDLDFCIRAGDAGWRVRVVEEARVAHRGGATMQQWRDVDLAHDPALLWPDLLTWGRAHYGRRWAAIAVPLACGAGLVRIVARRMRELLLRGEARARSRSATAAYAAALRQLFVERKQLVREDVGRVALHDESPPGVADRPRPRR